MTLARWTQPSGPLCLWQCFLQRSQVQMEDPMHENQVHNKVIDIAIFFEGIGYKVWQNRRHNSRNCICARFSIDGPTFLTKSGGFIGVGRTLLWILASLLGAPQVTKTTVLQLPGDFFLQLPDDFFTITRWCFYNCQVMRKLKSSDLWTRWCCKTKRDLDNAPTTFRSESLRTV